MTSVCLTEHAVVYCCMNIFAYINFDNPVLTLLGHLDQVNGLL